MVTKACKPRSRGVETGKLGVQGYPWLHSKFEAGTVYMRVCLGLQGCYRKQGMLDLFHKVLWFPVHDGGAKRRTMRGGQTRARWCIDVKFPVEGSLRFPAEFWL